MSNFFSFDRDYADSTRAVDSMLARFDVDRKIVTNLLKTSPNTLVQTLWKTNSPISKDENCLFQMGKNLAMSIDDLLNNAPTICDTMANFYICPQCKNMRRLIEFSGSKRTNEQEPFILECGEKAGTSLCYEEKRISSLTLKIESPPYSVKRAYTSPYIAELAQCSSATCPIPSKEAGSNLLMKYMETDYLGSDTFTNNMLINFYLNEELTKQKMPHILHTNISFVCDDKGYNINEYLDIGKIGNFQEFPEFLETDGKPSPTAKADDKLPISASVSKSIIMQLFASLNALRKYDFSHGNPSTETIRFSKEVVSYIYDGVHVAGPVTLKLSDFSTSGCTVTRENENFLRLYSKSVVADEELKKRVYEPIIETLNLDNSESKVTVYKLKNPCKCVKSSILFMYMKHLGLPVYAASFDAYSFMTILMCERSFYAGVMMDLDLARFWRSMWLNDDEFNVIDERVKEFHEKSEDVSSKNILKLLSDLSLRCDMIDFGWNLIKNF